MLMRLIIAMTIMVTTMIMMLIMVVMMVVMFVARLLDVPATCRVYLTDGSAQTAGHAATLS